MFTPTSVCMPTLWTNHLIWSLPNKYPTGRKLYIGQLCEPSQATNSDTFTKKDSKGSPYYTIFQRQQQFTEAHGTGAGPVDPPGPTNLPSGHALSNLIVHRSRHELPTPTNWWQTGKGTSCLVVSVWTVDSLSLLTNTVMCFKWALFNRMQRG